VSTAKQGGGRDLKVRVKTGKGRSLSSKLWLERQLNDPYVARAKRDALAGAAIKRSLRGPRQARRVPVARRL
jgi:hypothetical protein